MIIDVSKLNKTKGGIDFSATDQAEPLLVEAFCSKYNFTDNGGTVGNVPEYDWIINDTLVEIKMSGNPNLFVEFGKANGDASGLEVTTSAIHMFVNPASSKIDGKWVDMMKVRLLKTSELRVWLNYMAKHHEDDLITFPPSKLGKGSIGFFLNLKNHKGPDVDDLFMLGFEYHKDDAGALLMDTQKIIMPDNKYAANIVHTFIE